MDTFSAMIRGEVARASGAPARVFDWNKAVDLIKEHGIKNASAGLESDLEWTGGTILENGEPKSSEFCYLFSVWATPILIDDDTGKEYDCYIYADEEHNPNKWNEHTIWPKEVLERFQRIRGC